MIPRYEPSLEKCVPLVFAGVSNWPLGFMRGRLVESQLPQKTVNLILQLVIVNNNLTILWRSWLSETNQ